MKEKKPEPSLFSPKAVNGFSTKTAFCIPYDPAGIFRKHLEPKSSLVLPTPFGTYYRFRDYAAVIGGIGAPASVISLERLIASGVRNIIFFGFCGSLNPQIPRLNVVIPHAAISQEGTSRHYLPDKKVFTPSERLKNILSAALKQSQIESPANGSIVSTDAPFRETKTWLMRNLEGGIDFVDMELSAVFALAEFRNIEASAVLIVSDELYGTQWTGGFRDPQMEDMIHSVFFPLFDSGPLLNC